MRPTFGKINLDVRALGTMNTSAATTKNGTELDRAKESARARARIRPANRREIAAQKYVKSIVAALSVPSDKS